MPDSMTPPDEEMKLVERLRALSAAEHDDLSLGDEAADLIEQLVGDRDRSVEALRPFAEAAVNLDEDHRDHIDIWDAPAAMSIDAGHLRAARAIVDGAGK